MNVFNLNISISSNKDCYDRYPNFLSLPESNNSISHFIQDLSNSDFNENSYINGYFKDISTKNEKQSEKEKNNEISFIYGPFFDLEINDIILDNSKKPEVLDKILPLKKEKIFEVIYSNDSKIFNYGTYDNYSKQMIDEALNQTNKMCKKEVNMDSNLHYQSSKKRGKKRKNIYQRKQNSDNIRKKIKSRFLKSLKTVINLKLKKAGSKYIFTFLPQSFICNLSKKKNKEVLNLTLKEIFEKNFCDEKERRADLNKYNHNLSVLNYLEKNQEISEKSNFNIIKNMKYSEIFNEYLKSKEFGLEITTLKQEKENDKYIKNYIIKAINFLDFLNH